MGIGNSIENAHAKYDYNTKLEIQFSLARNKFNYLKIVEYVLFAVKSVFPEIWNYAVWKSKTLNSPKAQMQAWNNFLRKDVRSDYFPLFHVRLNH